MKILYLGLALFTISIISQNWAYAQIDTPTNIPPDVITTITPNQPSFVSAKSTTTFLTSNSTSVIFGHR